MEHQVQMTMHHELLWIQHHYQHYLLLRIFQRDHPPASEVLKHNLFKLFLEDMSCEMCKRTKTTRAPCRRNPEGRADRMPQAENFGDSISADHKISNEESESPLHYKIFSCIFFDLATQWI